MSFQDGNEAKNDVMSLDAKATLGDFAMTVDLFLLDRRVRLLFLVVPVIHYADSFCFEFSLSRVVCKSCGVYLNVGASDVDRLDRF